MPTRDELSAAVEQGIIDADQAEKLSAFLAARGGDNAWDAPSLALTETEDVRFARGFHDIFMTVGVVLLFAGLAVVAGATESFATVFGASAALAWALAEFLTARRRLVLPSIALAICFVALLVLTVAAAIAGNQVSEVLATPNYVTIIALGTALVGALLFFTRFRLPFAVGLAGAVGVVLVLAIVKLAAPDFMDSHTQLILLACGIAAFMAAMAFDLSDPGRKTLRADNAFWLHLLAAPLLVHTIISYVPFREGGGSTLSGAMAVIGVISVLALVALLVDRRALLVAGLSYFAAALTVLIQSTQFKSEMVLATTLLILGAGVIALGAGWRPVRRLIFKTLPLPKGFLEKLPPVAAHA